MKKNLTLTATIERITDNSYRATIINWDGSTKRQAGFSNVTSALIYLEGNGVHVNAINVKG